jgi:hypothetical protein
MSCFSSPLLSVSPTASLFYFRSIVVPLGRNSITVPTMEINDTTVGLDKLRMISMFQKFTLTLHFMLLRSDSFCPFPGSDKHISLENVRSPNIRESERNFDDSTISERNPFNLLFFRAKYFYNPFPQTLDNNHELCLLLIVFCP